MEGNIMEDNTIEDNILEESLGSGFDNIRAAILSPRSFAPRLTAAPVFTQTITDLERSPYMPLLAGPGLPSFNPDLMDGSFYNTSNVRVDSRAIATPGHTASATYSNEVEYSDDETQSALDDERSSESFACSTSPLDRTLIGYSEYLSGVDQDTEIGTFAQLRLLKGDSPPQSEGDDYESDSDDTVKFYTELDAHHTLRDDDGDTDDYDSDNDDERSHTGQLLASISRYDYRYHRYWDTEQADLVNNTHFDAPLQATHERNFTVEQFIKRWLQASLANSAHVPPQFPCPSLEAANVLQWRRQQIIVRPWNIGSEFYDIQQIPWREKLGVRREDARVLRDAWYSPYSNLNYSHDNRPSRLPRSERYFLEKAFYTGIGATIEHFQLRNLMAVTSFNTVQFARDSEIISWTPGYKNATRVMDLGDPEPETGFRGPVKISTMQSKHGVCVAGGFAGEFCMHVNGSEEEDSYGFVTKDPNGITNHIDIIRSRTADSSPMVVFASNDQHIRILDSTTNRFISDHELPIPVNCSETSADGRMRIVVGDSPKAYVLEADSGRTLQQLSGHHDFGFACAWSPDMLHIATSNQDRTVNIWDVRMWRILQSMDSDCAGYRSLRFSPIGGGPRTLLMSEPADRISIVNATTYETRQVHDFFGEIGGADYSPDGDSIWVANTDEIFGGFMKFDRMQYGQKYGSSRSLSSRSGGSVQKRQQRRRRRQLAPEWYSDLPHEWVSEAGLENDSRCVVSRRERDFRVLNGLSDEARDNLLI